VTGTDDGLGRRYEGRVAVVTGASRGIGLAIAERLVAEGARVCLTARGAEDLQTAATSLGGEQRAIGVAGRADDPAHRAAALGATVDAFGRVDVLVNNTGINPVFGATTDVSTEAAAKIFGVNVLAALAAGLACGAAPESMRRTIQRFEPVEHRLELVAEIRSVKFYNDSKATSVDATLKALEAFADEDGQVVLILGGRGKKAPYTPLSSLVREKVRKLILIGEDADTIASELGEFAPADRAKDMKDAVELSFEAARPGDTVLLAPACASFDMFETYEHRGRVFKDAVQSLKSKVQSQSP